MKHIHVVAAIIINNEEFLCVQRDVNKFEYISKKFEFPGGKIEDGESKEEALAREIKEELDLDIQIQKDFLTVNYDYPDFKLTMYSFLCTCNNRNLALKEHISSKWCSRKELKELDWAAADIPIVNKLKSN